MKTRNQRQVRKWSTHRFAIIEQIFHPSLAPSSSRVQGKTLNGSIAENRYNFQRIDQKQELTSQNGVQDDLKSSRVVKGSDLQEYKVPEEGKKCVFFKNK